MSCVILQLADQPRFEDTSGSQSSASRALLVDPPVRTTSPRWLPRWTRGSLDPGEGADLLDDLPEGDLRPAGDVDAGAGRDVGRGGQQVGRGRRP